MKNQFHRSLTIMMAFLILLSSVGFRFIEHQCLMRSESTMMVAQKEGDSCEKKVESACCAAKKQKNSQATYFKKTDCCKETQKFEKLDVAPSAISKLLSKSLDISADGILWLTQSFQFISSQWSSSTFDEHTRPNTFSSRLYGRSMHFFIQSFLI